MRGPLGVRQLRGLRSTPRPASRKRVDGALAGGVLVDAVAARAGDDRVAVDRHGDAEVVVHAAVGSGQRGGVRPRVTRALEDIDGADASIAEGIAEDERVAVHGGRVADRAAACGGQRLFECGGG